MPPPLPTFFLQNAQPRGSLLHIPFLKIPSPYYSPPLLLLPPNQAIGPPYSTTPGIRSSPSTFRTHIYSIPLCTSSASRSSASSPSSPFPTPFPKEAHTPTPHHSRASPDLSSADASLRRYGFTSEQGKKSSRRCGTHRLLCAREGANPAIFRAPLGQPAWPVGLPTGFKRAAWWGSFD